MFLFSSVQKLFSTLEVLGASEMSLGANQWKDDMNRMQWNTGNNYSGNNCYLLELYLNAQL